jgi:hypothetical protein
MNDSMLRASIVLLTVSATNSMQTTIVNVVLRLSRSKNNVMKMQKIHMTDASMTVITKSLQGA